MKKKISLILRVLLNFLIVQTFITPCFCQAATGSSSLKVVIIRHAEKPDKGDNLTCQGLNRSLKLPGILYSKYGVPTYTYIPSVGKGKATKHARMFQTITPMAVKYNLVVNSKYDENDAARLASDILEKKGLVLVVWQHSSIPALARSLGVGASGLNWDSNDYDSIWVITFSNGVASISTDHEGVTASPACSF